MLVGAFNQEKTLVGAFSVIVKTGCGTDGSICGTSLYLTLQFLIMIVSAPAAAVVISNTAIKRGVTFYILHLNESAVRSNGGRDWFCSSLQCCAVLQYISAANYFKSYLLFTIKLASPVPSTVQCPGQSRSS